MKDSLISVKSGNAFALVLFVPLPMAGTEEESPRGVELREASVGFDEPSAGGIGGPSPKRISSTKTC